MSIVRIILSLLSYTVYLLPLEALNMTLSLKRLWFSESPKCLCCLIEDLYKFSSFRIICDFCLSKKFYIVRGTKTGDPLSAVLSFLVIDRVCKPMVAAALVSLNIENERNINTVPLQAFADDIAVVQSKVEVIQKMFDVGESLMDRAGLEVKLSKCAVLYARRSETTGIKGNMTRNQR